MIMTRPDSTVKKPLEEEYRPIEVSAPGVQRLLYLGNWDWNLRTNKYSWSEEMYRIFQVAPQPNSPRTCTFLNCVHPEDREQVVKALGKALVGEEAYHIKHRILWPDGSVRQVQGEATVIFDPAGRPLRMFGTVQDITALQQTL
jgi:PAS domain-containing protein